MLLLLVALASAFAGGALLATMLLRKKRKIQMGVIMDSGSWKTVGGGTTKEGYKSNDGGRTWILSIAVNRR